MWPFHKKNKAKVFQIKGIWEKVICMESILTEVSLWVNGARRLRGEYPHKQIFVAEALPSTALCQYYSPRTMILCLPTDMSMYIEDL